MGKLKVFIIFENIPEMPGYVLSYCIYLGVYTCKVSKN